MAFKFQYENLLEYRKHILRKEEHQLSNIAKIARDLQRECEKLKVEKMKCTEAFTMKQKEGLPAGEYIFFCDNLEAMEQRLLDQEAKLKEVLNSLEQQRQKLLEAKKQVEMLNMLKENEETEYKREEFKKDQKRLDELSIQKRDEKFYER